MLDMYTALLLGAVPAFLTVRFLFLTAGSPPIFGVYSQPNRWYKLKFCMAYVMLGLRKLKGKSKPSRRTNEPLQGAGYGASSRSTVQEMDCPQELPLDAPFALDAVYFVAANREGFHFVVGTARRPNRVINGFWYLRIPGVGLLKSPKLPDTTLVTDHDMEFSTTDGMLIKSVVPMKQWQITYDGPMKLEGRDNETIHTQIDFEWKTDLPYFDFDTDIPPRPMARALARELWSRQFFASLKETHQTHHEQMGYMTGKIKISGIGEFEVSMNSMRDHSYANKRDWKRMHRYGLHSVTVEDGTKFCVGIIAQVDITRFEMGYLYTPNGKLYGVDECDLELYLHGEGGTPPLDYSFTFKAGGRQYRVECEVMDSPELFIGDEWEARIIERMCKFRVNGKAGWGFAEWEYRNRKGKTQPV